VCLFFLGAAEGGCRLEQILGAGQKTNQSIFDAVFDTEKDIKQGNQRLATVVTLSNL
jgi:hypothetical protein